MGKESQEVILVDERDNIVGSAEKLAAHREGGRLHRAFSVLIYNSQREMLLQRRAASKYHFGGLWTNACCGHPSRDGLLEQEASERLYEEFGFQTPVRKVFSFLYEAHDPHSGLTEREFDHVLEGTFDGIPRPDAKEIEDFKWITMAELTADMRQASDAYTPWFQILMEKVPAQSQ